MSRILFDVARPVVDSDPARSDVALFVGLARATGTALPQSVQDWLQTHGWTDGIISTLAASVAPTDTQITLTAPLVGTVQFLFVDQEVVGFEAVDKTGTVLSVDRGDQNTMAVAHAAGATVQGIVSQFSRPIGPPFSDIPIPIENYAGFTALFDPGGSPQSFGTDYLAVAVRSFFAQGGRRCYVVRMDDPVSQTDNAASKLNKLSELLFGDLFSTGDQRTWHGVGHLAGLPDVSYLAVPDLPVLVASNPVTPFGAVPAAPIGVVQFLECSPTAAVSGATPLPSPSPSSISGPAPRLTPPDYDTWANTVLQILSPFKDNFREVQFVAAFPMPQDLDSATASENLTSGTLAQDVHNIVAKWMPESPGQFLSTAFLQLTYPWLKTSGSVVLGESLEPPDGLLVGLLARNALTRGAFMDATKIVPAELSDVSPLLPAQDLQVPSTPLVWAFPNATTYTWTDPTPKPLITRLSLFGFTPLGLRLLSDVSTFPGESYRPACVHRLVSVISRAARRLGEQIVFENNGPPLWARVERSLQQLMMRLWQLNALDGDTIQDAFTVRCDSSTIVQNDLDNGRLIAQVTFQAAATIELIHVTLALETSGTSAQSVGVLAEANG